MQMRIFSLPHSLAVVLVSALTNAACGAEYDDAPVLDDVSAHDAVDTVDDAVDIVDDADDVVDDGFDVVAGRELFLHAWSRGDPRSRGGDGLGPLFNASSCVACHSQGGVGG